MNLNSKKIIIAVSGGIAAYKACDLVRLLVKSGSEVRVMMTESAKQFISPLTFETLSNHEVAHEMFNKDQFTSTRHIDWADWADVVVFAPCTANVIGKLANGIYDDLFTTVSSAFTGHKLIAPAMNSNMWNNSIVKENIYKLKKHGYTILPTDSGDLACGWVGEGRLTENKVIIQFIKQALTEQKFKKKKILISSGPTIEDIDPVRYLSNRSSGKMGHALARASWCMGADVTLVTGPSTAEIPFGVKLISIRSADNMHQVISEEFPKYDLFISASAVADYTINKKFESKIKKSSGIKAIELIETIDILGSLKKRADQTLVGFALETDNIKENAYKKLDAKNLDYIILNDATKEGITFESDENEVLLIDKSKNEHNFPKDKKENLAFELLKQIKLK